MPYPMLSDKLAVTRQVQPDELPAIAAAGYRTLVCNRPDGEAPDQPDAQALRDAAAAHGIDFIHQPVVGSAIGDADVDAFAHAVATAGGPVLAFCRTGTRSATLWALAEARTRPAADVIADAGRAGYDLSPMQARLDAQASTPATAPRDSVARFDVVVVGGGAGGLATIASLLRRRAELKICLVEPAQTHAYQPGWTMVGAGVFDKAQTLRPMASLVPDQVDWRKAPAVAFDPAHNEVQLQDGTRLGYRVLVVAPGLKLDWAAIPGLAESLGQHGVTSNYREDLAPYTWSLVQSLARGKALFTQPPMPIKCAGAPQKAMYLSADHWRSAGRLEAIDIEFHNAGAALFGVEAYVPALMRYVERYGIDLKFGSRLVSIDGPAKTAVFRSTSADGSERDDAVGFDMIHVCPPQTAPDFIRASPLANEAGWLDIAQDTLRHVRHPNIFGLGDAGSTPNAKTAAAVRKQAPVVAENVLATLDGEALPVAYDGYGSCPLTVERGKIVLAEFGYGGKLLPTFPRWLINGRRPSRLAWYLKSGVLPAVYWNVMLKGREWLCAPKRRVTATD